MDSTGILLALLGALTGAAAVSFALRPRLAAAAGERDAALARAAVAETRATAAEAEAGAVRSTLAERDRTDAALRDAFKALSAEALDQTTRQFATLAEETIKRATTEARGDLDQRRQAVEHLVTPLRDSLTKVETHLRQVEREREGAYRALSEQVTSMREVSEKLRGETSALVTALRTPHARGRWGEMQLRRVVELAGMVEHCDFSEQVTTDAPDGRVRPDLVVHLAGGKHVVVDAKVPLDAYLRVAEATDENARRAALVDHARQLRTHVDALAKKAYATKVAGTPEFVVLFVPGDTLLGAALEQQPDLWEHAVGQSVVLATPTTLIALLRTVGHAWRQEALAENARQVCELGRELYSRLSTMGGHVDGLGKALERAVGAYNKTVGSLERNVLPQARRFRDLKVTDAPLSEPSAIGEAPRPLTAPELVASAAEVRPMVVLPPPDDDEVGPLAAWSG